MNRRGVALIAALLVLLLLGALAMLALAAGRLRARAGDRGLSLARARAAALSGVARGEAEWDPQFAASLAVGAAATLPGSPRPAQDGVTSHDSLLRLGRFLYVLRSVGEHRTPDGRLLAREGIARLVRSEGPGLPDSAAVLALGSVVLLADSAVSGNDAVPPGWTGACGTADSARVGLGHAGQGWSAGCPSGTCLTGNPPDIADSLLGAGFLDRFPVAGFPVLASRPDAHVTVPLVTPLPQLVGGACDRTRFDNWGDPSQPTGPCGDYFPVVLVESGTVISDGIGQGVLLAAGSLTIRGGTRFAGAILAKGQLVLEDQVQVSGAVLAEGGVTVQGTARIERSTCAVRRALEGVARPVRPVSRGWWRWP